MKVLGMSKKIDELGRVVLPVEARRTLDLNQGDLVSIFLESDDETIILKKCKPSCFCCQSTEHLKALPHGKYLCAACLQQVM